MDDGVTRVEKLPSAATGTEPSATVVEGADWTRFERERRDSGRGSQPPREQRPFRRGRQAPGVASQRHGRPGPIHGHPGADGRNQVAGHVADGAHRDHVEPPLTRSTEGWYDPVLARD